MSVDKSKSFDIANAPRSVTMPTDPAGALVGAPYPKHLYRFFVPVKDDAGNLVLPEGVEHVLVVAWDKKTPIYNEYVEVADAKAEAEAQGFSDKPVLKAPKKVEKVEK